MLAYALLLLVEKRLQGNSEHLFIPCNSFGLAFLDEWMDVMLNWTCMTQKGRVELKRRSQPSSLFIPTDLSNKFFKTKQFPLN